MKIRNSVVVTLGLLMLVCTLIAGAAPAGAQPSGAKPTPTPKPKKTNCETPRPEQQAIISKTGDVRISNVAYVGKGEYVEVKNFGATPANIAGWTIRDKNEVTQKYTFPAGTTLPKGGTVRVYTYKSTASKYSFNKKQQIWNDCGDALDLLNPGNTVVATYAYGSHVKR